MRFTLWGTRGSLPSAGPDTIRYGGNTACVEVRGPAGTLLVLDAGTGIRRLNRALGPEISRVDILLTHLHMDHVQGLGFFEPIFNPDREVHVWGPPSTTLDLRTRLTRYLSPPLFPVRLRDLPGRPVFHDVPLGPFSIPGFEVTAALVCHPGPTVGYRLTAEGGSLAYIPDHEPALGVREFPEEPEWTSGFALARGVDVLIHDAQYSASEYARHVGWGHSAISHAIALATMSKVKRLIAFHHDPSHTDEILDQLLTEARGTVPLPFEFIPGCEGTTFHLAGRS